MVEILPTIAAMGNCGPIGGGGNERKKSTVGASSTTTTLGVTANNVGTGIYQAVSSAANSVHYSLFGTGFPSSSTSTLKARGGGSTVAPSPLQQHNKENNGKLRRTTTTTTPKSTNRKRITGTAAAAANKSGSHNNDDDDEQSVLSVPLLEYTDAQKIAMGMTELTSVSSFQAREITVEPTFDGEAEILLSGSSKSDGEEDSLFNFDSQQSINTSSSGNHKNHLYSFPKQSLTLKLLRGRNMPVNTPCIRISLLDDDWEDDFSVGEATLPLQFQGSATGDNQNPIWGGRNFTWTIYGNQDTRIGFFLYSNEKETNYHLAQITVTVADLLRPVSKHPNVWLDFSSDSSAMLPYNCKLQVRLSLPGAPLLHPQQNCQRITPGPAIQLQKESSQTSYNSYILRKMALYSCAPVMLNVYDVSNNHKIENLNKYIKATMGAGIFHAAIEVHGKEYSFGGTRRRNTKVTGVFGCPPKKCPMHHYRESVYLGDCDLTQAQVEQILEDLRPKWRACTYNVFRKNCCFFSREFAIQLGVGDIPEWVYSLAESAGFIEPYLVRLNTHLQQNNFTLATNAPTGIAPPASSSKSTAILAVPADDPEDKQSTEVVVTIPPGTTANELTRVKSAISPPPPPPPPPPPRKIEANGAASNNKSKKNTVVSAPKTKPPKPRNKLAAYQKPSTTATPTKTAAPAASVTTVKKMMIGKKSKQTVAKKTGKTAANTKSTEVVLNTAPKKTKRSSSSSPSSKTVAKTVEKKGLSSPSPSPPKNDPPEKSSNLDNNDSDDDDERQPPPPPPPPLPLPSDESSPDDMDNLEREQAGTGTGEDDEEDQQQHVIELLDHAMAARIQRSYRRHLSNRQKQKQLPQPKHQRQRSFQKGLRTPSFLKRQRSRQRDDVVDDDEDEIQQHGQHQQVLVAPSYRFYQEEKMPMHKGMATDMCNMECYRVILSTQSEEC